MSAGDLLPRAEATVSAPNSATPTLAASLSRRASQRAELLAGGQNVVDVRLLWLQESQVESKDLDGGPSVRRGEGTLRRTAFPSHERGPWLRLSWLDVRSRRPSPVPKLLQDFLPRRLRHRKCSNASQEAIRETRPACVGPLDVQSVALATPDQRAGATRSGSQPHPDGIPDHRLGLGSSAFAQHTPDRLVHGQEERHEPMGASPVPLLYRAELRPYLGRKVGVRGRPHASQNLRERQRKSRKKCAPSVASVVAPTVVDGASLA